jgi:hypothetical protein
MIPSRRWRRYGERRWQKVMDLGSAEMRSLLKGSPRVSCAGEFQIEEGLARRLSGLRGDQGTVAECEAAAKLGLDYLACSVGQGRELALPVMLNYGFFVFVLVEGGFTQLVKHYGLGETLSLLANRPEEGERLIHHLLSEQMLMADSLLEAGAGGIILAEDVAYDRGLFFSMTTFSDVVLPEIREAQRPGVPVVFHSDGDISSLLRLLKPAGIDGLHSCETAGAMSPALAARELGDATVLMGGLARRALLSGGPDASDAATDLRRTMRGLRHCFGSSTGILDDEMDADRVTAAFGALPSEGFNARHVEVS